MHVTIAQHGEAQGRTADTAKIEHQDGERGKWDKVSPADSEVNTFTGS